MSDPHLVVVVVQGVDTGTQLSVGGASRRIGRSLESDLVVTDPGVSRAHLDVVMEGDALRIRCVDGAAPFVHDGVESTDALLRPGQKIVVADTVLAVVEHDVLASPAAASRIEVTATRGLLQGLAADVRSLRSIAELVAALDAAHDDAAIEHALGAWSRAHAGAVRAAVLRTDALRADPAFARLAEPLAELVVAPVSNADTVDIAAAAHAETPAAAIFFGVRASSAGDELRRLLAVAGRVVASALARVALERSLGEAVDSLRTHAVGSARAFLGHSPAAIEVARLVSRLAAADATALILGESGTGKSFVARLIHESSPRAKEPFRVLNCAAIPESLLESELFGHERGAFSGAVAAHAGAFEAAGRGTILLDEIGELSLASQAKLLRVLEERRFERVGSNKSLVMEARVLAATNRGLAAMVEKGTFRQDLFFRISVVSIRVPPLRDRGDDIVLLAKQLLSDLAATSGRRVTGFSASAIDVLRTHAWPGNVRELRNAIEHALVLGDGPTIEPKDLPESLRAGSIAKPVADGDTVRLPAKLDWLEERAIEAALRATGGNRTKAAALLGINRATLYKKLREEEE